MTRITVDVLSGPRGTVAAGDTLTTKVKVDNLETTGPLITNPSCRVNGQPGEKVQVHLQVVNSSGKIVDSTQKQVCAQYGQFASSAFVTFTYSINKAGSYTIHIYGKSNVNTVNVVKQPKQFDVTVKKGGSTGNTAPSGGGSSINLGGPSSSPTGSKFNLGEYIIKHPAESAIAGIGGAIAISALAKSVGNTIG